MILSYIATALVLLGVYFISKPRLLGQYVMLFADLTWLTYALLTNQFALAIQSVVLLCICLSAIKNWKRQGIKL